MEAVTQRIAVEFAANGDLAAARKALEELDVANPNQWLVYVAENAIADGTAEDVMIALVRLVQASGLQSTKLENFAAQRGLMPIAAAAVEVDAPPVTAAEPAAPAIGQSVTGGVAQVLGSEAAAAPAESTAGEAGDDQTVVLLPTATVPAPTPTAQPAPVAVASQLMNVRGGPGLGYNIVGSMQPGEQAEILGKNPEGDWWQVRLAVGQEGWLYDPLVDEQGTLENVAVAADIPPAPPTPVVQAPPEPEPEPEPKEEEAPPEPQAPADDEPRFTLVEKRLWGKQENDGCVGKHLLRIHVFDANGNRLNGVVLQGIYVGEILVTGSQGKGDGVIEYDLHGSGEGFFVLRDADGRSVSSDRAEGFTTISPDIPQDTLIAAGYCSDDATCADFYHSYGCSGHHSWEAKFVRNY